MNDTLKSCRVSTIDEFSVCFELDDGSKSHVDGWIDFAISKGVKRLELDFTATSPFKDASNFYRFPNERFTSDKTCIKSLTSLTLKYIRVTGELLEHFLSNCPLLERLHVDNSEDLVNLKIYGSSLKLKYLHIIRCLEFKSIEINAPNLESFGYVGNEIRLHVHSAPRLLDVRIGGMYSHPIYYAFGSLSSYLYQLESLTLDVHSYTYVSTSNSFAISYIYVYLVLQNLLSSLIFFLFRMALNSLNFKLLPSLNTLRSQLPQMRDQASSV